MKRWLAALWGLWVGACWGGTLGIAPPRLDIPLEGPTAAAAVTVVNLDANPVHLKVSLVHWRLDERNRLEVVPPNPQSADQWLVVTPLDFVLEPQKSQTVRLLVRPRVKPEPGEHRAMMFLEEQPPEKGELVVTNLARVGVGVYVNVPPVVRKAKFWCADAGMRGQEALGLLDLESLGNAHVRPAVQYVVWEASRFPGKPGTVRIQESPTAPVVTPAGAAAAGLVPDIPVLPGTRRKLVFSLGQELSPGQYWLDLFGTVDGEEIREAVPFVVVSSAQP